MRKALIAMVLLLALCAGGAAAVQVGVNEARDQVVITEKILFGNKEDAEGLTVRAETMMDGHLHWDTTYTIGAEPTTQTQYRFTADEEYRNGSYEPSGIYVQGPRYVVDRKNWAEAESSEGLTGLDLAYWNLLQETQPGKERERTIFMRDYYEYYPVSLRVELPNYIFESDWDNYYTSSQEQEAEMKRLEQRLREYLKVPVLKNEKLEISLTKGENGLVRGYGSGTADSDRYDMGIYNVLTDNACYFILHNRSYEGKIMDLSQVPGGYGIHMIPFTLEEGDAYSVTSVDVDGISMAYPLDEESRIIWFTATEDKSRLLLMTQEGDGTCLLRVIDCADMSTLQEIPLYQVTEERSPWVEVCREGYLVIRTSDLGMMVLEEREDGGYDLAFDIPITEEEQVSLGIGVTLWDGERLVMASPLRYETKRAGEMCGFTVGVYDASGALFGGQYTSSLDTKNYDYYHNLSCTLLSVDPLHLSWNE